MGNNEYENEMTNEQLDSLLREVEVPADLKSQLRSIPMQLEEPTVTKQTKVSAPSSNRMSKRNSGLSWRTWVVAGSILGIAAFQILRLEPTPSIPVNDPAAVAIISADNSEANVSTADSTNLYADELEQLELLNREFAQRQNFWQEQELNQLESDLVDLQRTAARSINQRESNSVILALSAETAISFGGSEESVKEEMAMVIAEYPGSHGAKIATEFLQRRTN